MCKKKVPVFEDWRKKTLPQFKKLYCFMYFHPHNLYLKLLLYLLPLQGQSKSKQLYFNI